MRPRSKTQRKILAQIATGEPYYFHYDYRAGTRTLDAARALQRQGLLKLVSPVFGPTGYYTCFSLP